MSDTSRGPGWWLASDGKWYPPETAAPSPIPPPPQTSAPSPLPMPSPSSTTPAGGPVPPAYVPVMGGPESNGGTNGLAIAALVLGILWLCAIGSVLAIVFGFVALNQIKRSGQGGRGLAIAGVVLGIIGILASIVTLIAVRAGVEEIVDNQPDEFDDVEIIDCRRGLDGRGVAELEITNDSSKRSSYFITVEFRAAGSDDDLGYTLDPETGVDPGESRRITATSTDRIEAERLECRIALVERVATE
jgi:Domain of unknown function (DUF4190)